MKQVPAKDGRFFCSGVVARKSASEEDGEEKNTQPTWRKEVGELGPLPSALTVEARGMSEVTKTILNPAIRFKDGGPSWGSGSRRRSLLLRSSFQAATTRPRPHRSCRIFLFFFLPPAPGSVQLQKMSEKGGSCSQERGASGCRRVPAALLFEAGTSQSRPAVQTVGDCISNGHRGEVMATQEDPVSLCSGQERGGRAGGRLGGGGVELGGTSLV